MVGKTPDTKSFYAHKFVLSMSSPVFEAWFRFNGNLAKSEQEITLSDEEPAAFENLLQFIYTDEVDVNANNVLDTLYTAKKYLIPQLEKRCINYLGTCLEPESAFYLLTKVSI